MDRAVLDATDTCFYLRLTAETLRTLVKHGHIPYRQLGTHTLFLIDELNSWFQGLPGVHVEEALARMHDAATAPAPVSTIAKVKQARAG
jgi:excisionase family DNA binding protein